MARKGFRNLSSTEQLLEAEVELLIFDAIGQYPTDISCKFTNESVLAILIENVRTPLEVFLDCHCQSDTVHRYNVGMEEAIERRVKRLIEKTVNRPVEQTSMSCKTKTRWMGVFVLM